MGHKVHPYGFRIGINKPWLAKWYADRDYATLLREDMRIRQLVGKQLANASVSQVEIERGINHVTVTVHSAKPGIVIGKGGQNVELLRTSIGKLTDKSDPNFGYDAQSGEYKDMVKAGIIDPTKVVRVALQDAASVAGLLITTEGMVADRPEPKVQPSMPPGGGMGGMGGMDF